MPADVGSGALKRNKKCSFCYRMFFFLVLLIFIVLLIPILFGRKPEQEWIGDRKTPLVLLYHGKPENAPYEWNTGVWPAWGERINILFYNIYFLFF